VLEKVGLEHSSKSTKYELEGSYGDPVHEHFSFLKTAKLPRECNEDDDDGEFTIVFSLFYYFPSIWNEILSKILDPRCILDGLGSIS